MGTTLKPRSKAPGRAICRVRQDGVAGAMAMPVAAKFLRKYGELILNDDLGACGSSAWNETNQRLKDFNLREPLLSRVNLLISQRLNFCRH